MLCIILNDDEEVAFTEQEEPSHCHGEKKKHGKLKSFPGYFEEEASFQTFVDIMVRSLEIV